MSRIGKKLILIPAKIEVKTDKERISIKGPKGELTLQVQPGIKIEIESNQIKVSLEKEIKGNNALWGLTHALIFNMIKGVSEGFEKKLEIQGVGFRAELAGEELILNVGFSHPVNLKIPGNIKITVEKNIITVSGVDKELVGQVAANIRKTKKPEPYKGKGIRYLGEQVRRKAGKRVIGAAGAK